MAPAGAGCSVPPTINNHSEPRFMEATFVLAVITIGVVLIFDYTRRWVSTL